VKLYHWVYQTLVPIAQIGREPPRGFVDGLGGPLSIRKVDSRKLPVLLGGVLKPGENVSADSRKSKVRALTYMGILSTWWGNSIVG
jgi:hypothetical protein